MKGQKYEVVALERRLVVALQKDVDQLAQKFSQLQSTHLDVFAELFIEKEFSTIFLGRLSISDLIEFSENLFLHCVRYMVTDSNSDSENLYSPYAIGLNNKAYEICRLKLKKNRTISDRIFGIYMCYCLYFLQPTQYVLPIRISVPQMKNLHNFMHEVLLPEEHFEALFCLFRLLDSGAFTITPFETDFNPILARRFDIHDGNDSLFEIGELENGQDFLLLNELSKDITFKQLLSIHDVYKNMKTQCQIPGISDLNLVNTDLSHVMNELVQSTKTALENLNSMTKIDKNNQESTKSRRSRIRENAFAANPVRRRKLKDEKFE